MYIAQLPPLLFSFLLISSHLSRGRRGESEWFYVLLVHRQVEPYPYRRHRQSVLEGFKMLELPR